MYINHHHNHSHCNHTLLFCTTCDRPYCSKCNKEWYTAYGSGWTSIYTTGQTITNCSDNATSAINTNFTAHNH